MALIRLKDVGKIYVSGGNVAVGIRGVNLSFERGEFVAITGTSGSGKSTLLNVISGMDSYEEGELYIEGEPTSHYEQPDWEDYRRNYISFIFQDYNIIESFTVLQNVELALTHIDNPKQRRQRALELLRRVGLENHLHHKGSKLSGGQKQRTVIARALAKDSPIILADEPTGNLDSQTSQEIIQLLREVSKEKLVIVVTHNFEQVEAYATRHIRVFDGAVESDQYLSAAAPAAVESVAADEEQTPELRKRRGEKLRSGLTLGRARFFATPKLSIFLCILMIFSALAMTLVTSLKGGAALRLGDKDYLFTHQTGRTVLIRRDGAVITDEELEKLAGQVGATSTLHYDFLLDSPQRLNIGDNSYEFTFAYDAFDGIEAGRAPAADNEVLLRVPVSLRSYFGTDSFEPTQLTEVFSLADYTVVGVDYYYDNTQKPQMVFTQSGYGMAAALSYFAYSLDNFTAKTKVTDNQNPPETLSSTVNGANMHVSFDLEEGTYYLADTAYQNNVKHFETIKQGGKIKKYDYTIQTALSGAFTNYSYGGDYVNYAEDGYAVSSNPGYGAQIQVSSTLDAYQRLDQIDSGLVSQMNQSDWKLLLSPDIIADFLQQHYYSQAYTQASLFFADDAQAHAKVAELKELGYTAVVSDEVKTAVGPEAIIHTLSLLLEAFGWAIAVVFITLFLSLCSTRAMLATRGDIAILRSMGVSTPAIKMSIYIQMLIALIPTYLTTAAVAALIFTIPKTNAIFTYLHGWQYLVIALALLVIDLLLSKRYVKKMFSSSVKKTLRGGDGQ